MQDKHKQRGTLVNLFLLLGYITPFIQSHTFSNIMTILKDWLLHLLI
jgi:hypothetical protein